MANGVVGNLLAIVQLGYRYEAFWCIPCILTVGRCIDLISPTAHSLLICNMHIKIQKWPEHALSPTAGDVIVALASSIGGIW